MIEDIIILCINGRDEDIPNVNQNIEKLNNFKSYVFHDGNLRNCINKYNFSVISLDRSIGILYARKYIVEQIPDDYNNYYAVWFDSDDDFYLEELLFALSDNSYKNYDINGEINSNYHWNRIIKVSVLKKVFSYIPYNFNLSYSYKEDQIFTYILKSLKEFTWRDIRYHFINYNGFHGFHNDIYDSIMLKDSKIYIKIEKLVKCQLQNYLWKKDNLEYLSNLPLDFLDSNILLQDNSIIFKNLYNEILDKVIYDYSAYDSTNLTDFRNLYFIKLPLLSIVIPIYNADIYLSECILSIIEQNYKNIEIILVNDNSTDFSEKICLSFQQRDDRVQYIKLNENAGTSEARNIGLHTANGKYIAFVDHDDIVDSNFYLNAISKLERYPECIAYRCNFINLDTSKRAGRFISDIKQFKIVTYTQTDTGWFYIWNWVFHKKAISDFTEKYDEDIIFIQDYIIDKSIYQDKYIGYYHLVREDSAGALNTIHPYWDRLLKHKDP